MNSPGMLYAVISNVRRSTSARTVWKCATWLYPQPWKKYAYTNKDVTNSSSVTRRSRVGAAAGHGADGDFASPACASIIGGAFLRVRICPGEVSMLRRKFGNTDLEVSA